MNALPLFLSAWLTAAPATDVLATAKLQALVSTNCLSCHDSATRESGLDLEKLPTAFDDHDVFDKWVRVYDRLRAEEMPPKDAPAPGENERDAALRELASALNAADARRLEDRGRAAFRRLNRTEYENTLRDLFDLPTLNVAELLPEDGRVDGYDKGGDGLELSSVQLAKYMEAADVALDMAVCAQPDPPEFYRERHYPARQGGLNLGLFNGEVVFLKDMQYDDTFLPIVREQPPKEVVAEFRKGRKLQEYDGSVGVFRHEDDAFKVKFTSFAPVYPGRYRIRISVWSFVWNKGTVEPSPRKHTASLSVAGRALGYFAAPSLEPTVHEIEVVLNPGDEITFNAASLWPHRVSESGGRAAEYVGPGIAIDWFEVEGPIVDEWPGIGHRRMFGDLPLAVLAKDSPISPPKRVPMKRNGGRVSPQVAPIKDIWTVASPNALLDAERLLADFLPRAFRRLVEPHETVRYSELVKLRLAEGVSFEEAMRYAYKAALCSPDFLFLRELPGKLDDFALACRLSYFLWNSCPDDELTALAAAGKLRAAKALQQQALRMLDDPKSDRFVNDFLDQWLTLREIDFTLPDRKLYPEFRPDLRDAMLAESRAYFRELLSADEPATAVIEADFAMLNQRMAEHYGLFQVPPGGDAPPVPLVLGPEFRRTTLPPNSGRGGFLTQAAVLKVTANGTSTSPVKRGAWVLEKILGSPAPPPPADVPAIEPDIRGAVTIREQLARHRADPVCASCHARIDPPGFALESYDVIGGLRERYRGTDEGDAPDVAQTKSVLGARNLFYKLGRPVECSGETTNGDVFADVDEYKKVLLADPAQVADNLARQFLTYATGSVPTFADRPALAVVVDRAKANDYGVRSLLLECLASPLFLEK